ncbi:MAG: TIGR03668 family PPOX class F420-dependent oxidoreductase [Dehalococcoidia bacterium]
MLSSEQAAFVERRRVAHLATADADGSPHVVPVCFAWHEGAFWIAIDEKPKRGPQLKRLRNIEENERVALIFDHYADDWSQLGWVLVRGRARTVGGGDAPGALAALRSRYPQYERMALETRPLICVAPDSVRGWGDLSR